MTGSNFPFFKKKEKKRKEGRNHRGNTVCINKSMECLMVIAENNQGSENGGASSGSLFTPRIILIIAIISLFGIIGLLAFLIKLYKSIPAIPNEWEGKGVAYFDSTPINWQEWEITLYTYIYRERE